MYFQKKMEGSGLREQVRLVRDANRDLMERVLAAMDTPTVSSEQEEEQAQKSHVNGGNNNVDRQRHENQ